MPVHPLEQHVRHRANLGDFARQILVAFLKQALLPQVIELVLQLVL